MILIYEPYGFPFAAIDELRSLGPVVLEGSPYNPNDVEAIFIRLATKVEASFLDKFISLNGL